MAIHRGRRTHLSYVAGQIRSQKQKEREESGGLTANSVEIRVTERRRRRRRERKGEGESCARKVKRRRKVGRNARMNISSGGNVRPNPKDY
jgi:hypothetical protein